MKKQCNLCGLREDTMELVPQNKTWCLVFDKEVDNKFKGCEHWSPDSQSIRGQKVLIANGIKKDLQSQVVTEGIEESILLEPVQQTLLIEIVEASRNTPLDMREKFFIATSFGGDTLIHPSVPEEKSKVYLGDIEALANEGLISMGYGSHGTPNFDVAPKGFRYYEYLKGQLGEAVDRVVKTARSYLDTNNFIRNYPTAYEKWCAAEKLLWETDSIQQLTLIGHLCRESVQEFADQLILIHEVPNPPEEKTKTVARLKAVIDIKSVNISKTKKAFLDALLAYWGTVIDLIQRQEHDSLKEQEPLIWEDARMVVFQSLVVMFEIDRNL